ncbi:cuticlin-1 [Zootermopsis nevadensis]|uniref:cuticlin-1 n=1 Tax=Zootermopsis nevadensis TaxID=136037 RepID=UPI000B8ECFC5|nr:cuticlin-1 [Zootermopsis nevadensis]
MPAIQSLEVMCGKDHMDVHLSFTHPFEGIVSSKGQYADPRCVYVPPSSGKTFFSFRIAYARCGTKPDLHGQFYENTVVVQYDKDLLEVWDEAKRLRCEWFNDYEKTASKPPMVIADLDVIQLDFRGDNVDCWMEIQHGKGPWAPPVSGIVPLGSILTLVVAINDYRGEFDMRVKSCAASDGGGHVIQLSDEQGCVLRPKMISRFIKARAADERATVITYAFFHAFKFPDALSVHIKCKVEICRHGCLDHCQLGSHHDSPHFGPVDRKDQQSKPVSESPLGPELLIYDEAEDEEQSAGHFPVVVSTDSRSPTAQAQTHAIPAHKPVDEGHDTEPLRRPFQEQPRPGHRDGQERFPHGPRNLGEDDMPILDRSSSARSSTSQRKRRSIVVSDRKVRSADVGVSGLYEVISEVDLAFTPDMRAEAVTVFQGRMREEVVYGICLPVPGFSVLFVLVAVSAVVSALVAGSLLYRYQLQREAQNLAQQRAQQQQQQQQQQHTGTMVVNSLASWMALRLLRPRTHSSAATSPTQKQQCHQVSQAMASHEG